MSGSTKANPQRYENTIQKYVEKIESNFSKEMIFWMLGKSFVNNYFLLSKWFIQGLLTTIKSEKIQIWFDIINNLCNICTNNQDQAKTLQLLSIF